MAKCLDESASEIIDFGPMLEWLTIYCRGSVTTKLEILFNMYGCGEFIPMDRNDIRLVVSALLVPVSKFFSLDASGRKPEVDVEEQQVLEDLLNSMYTQRTDIQGKYNPLDLLQWSANMQAITRIERSLQSSRERERARRHKLKKQAREAARSPGERDPDEIDHEGTLYKVGRMLGGKTERWFVLKGRNLLSFKKKGEQHNDLIDLTNMKVDKTDDKSSFARNGFTIYPENNKGQGKTFILKQNKKEING